MDSSELGERMAIPILTTNNNGKVDVDVEALKRIFRHPKVQDKAVSIVSISGAFRKGKSFMLNFFLRYLRSNGYENSDWMGQEDQPLNEGFEWKGGRGACTNGIVLWSEVFTAVKDGKEVAILLMDTQGLFDNKSDNKTNSLIFALSTLISSVQIFNLTHQIQACDLGFLQFFTAYAQAARKVSTDSSIKPFQTLIFLVRDWQNAEELEYGMDGGDTYLEEVLKEDSPNKELSSVRKHLRSSFKNTKCCLMPHPGLRVSTTSKSFSGCLKDIDDNFLRHTAEFVDNLFKPENLIVKTINGQVVSALSILQYIVDCSESLTDGKLPNPKTMMENVAEAQNFEVQKRCSEKYQQNMKEALGDTFVEQDFLKEMHEQASSGALQEFAEMTRFGTEDSRRKHRDYLQSTIKREFGMLEQVNHSKKLEEESKMLEFIRGIVDTYENNMKGATTDAEFLPDLELDKIHSAFARETYEAYSGDKTVSPQLKDRYFEKMQGMMDRIYPGIKRENDDKRRIAEEQNEMKRALLILVMKASIKYREEMRPRVEYYAEESNLEQTMDGIRRTVMEEYKMQALETGASPGSTMWQEHENSLHQKIMDEHKQILHINDEKKAALEKSLESQRNKAYVAYEDVFKKLLKDTYMEKADLLQKHQAVVNELMNALRSPFEASETRITLIANHLQEVEKTLRDKYSMIEEWNEKNNTFLRKCSKVVKTVFAPLVGLAHLLGRIKLFRR